MVLGRAEHNYSCVCIKRLQSQQVSLQFKDIINAEFGNQ